MLDSDIPWRQVAGALGLDGGLCPAASRHRYTQLILLRCMKTTLLLMDTQQKSYTDNAVSIHAIEVYVSFISNSTTADIVGPIEIHLYIDSTVDENIIYLDNQTSCHAHDPQWILIQSISRGSGHSTSYIHRLLHILSVIRCLIREPSSLAAQVDRYLLNQSLKIVGYRGTRQDGEWTDRWHTRHKCLHC